MSLLRYIMLGLCIVNVSCSPIQDRLGWKAEDYFTDPKVIDLCKAINKKDVKKIDRLVKEGVDVNNKGKDNMTPLLWAFPSDEEVFKRMLEHGADPNIQITSDMGTHGQVMHAEDSVMILCAKTEKRII